MPVIGWLAAAWAGPFASTPSVGELPACAWQPVEVAFVGDIMQHGQQLAAARRPDGSYRYDGMLEPVAAWLRGPDLTVGNLETTLGGADAGYRGYPRFSSPDSLVDELVRAGFDVLQTANNHSMDSGVPGAVRTLAELDRRGLKHAGTRATADAAFDLRFEVAGLRVAFNAWTYPTEQLGAVQWPVQVLDGEAVEAWVRAVRRDADVVIVGVHWGQEYAHEPAPWQRDMARAWVAAGADVVVGEHPHVLQPAEVVTVDGRDGLVMYSLGNFVSNQRVGNRDGGAIARVTWLHCAARGQTWLADARFVPVWVDARDALGRPAFRVLPTHRCRAQGDTSAADCAHAARFRQHAARILRMPLDESFGHGAAAAARILDQPVAPFEPVPGYRAVGGPIR